MSAKIFHIPFIAVTPSLHLAAIVQRSLTPQNSAPKDHPSIAHYTAVQDLLSSPVDVVIIATPPPTHFSLVRSALEAGKHVLVEKPFVPSSSEASQVLSLARSKNRLLCVYQNRRWDADFLTLQRLIQDGELGRVVELNTHFDRYRPSPPTNWKADVKMRDGGGAIYDLGVHLLDQVYVLFGTPSSVSGKFVNARQGKIVPDDEGEGEEPDGLDALLVYDRMGTLVHVRIGIMSVAARQPRFWVRGTKGSYEKRGMDPQEDQLKAGMAVNDGLFGKEGPGAAGMLSVLSPDGKTVEDRKLPNLDPPETYAGFYKAFAKALQTGQEAELPVKGDEAIDVLRIVEAIRQSAKTGQDVRL
jgi:predicted dehydrogenase